eukprot:TRINITY_DN1862_c0_g1_i5.p2 TRINITY_DN1862_c0_g1~~TRINITY_DN1862_c0_g1_i5.p2  ORF type:complete len:144 (-),score=37.67 TRINITY_DN1862_c0_g1_i5:72-503(-)
MSLRDGKVKMSKSDPSELSRIHLADDADSIRTKVMRAKSDSESSVWLDREKRPEVANLLTIYAYLDGKNPEETALSFQGKQTSALKAELADLLVTSLQPFRTEYERLHQSPEYIENVLSEGANQAAEIATRNMDEIRRIVGYV